MNISPTEIWVIVPSLPQKWIEDLHTECWQIMSSVRIFLDILYDAKPFSIEKCIRPHFIMLSLQYAILLFFCQNVRKENPKAFR